MLINANFRRAWVGQTTSFLGDALFDTTLLLWISAELLTGQDYAPAVSSAILVAVAVVTIAVGPLAGVFADRWNSRRTLLACDAIRATLIGTLVLAAGITPAILSPIQVVLAIAVVVTMVTAVSQFFGPARAILIRDVVAPDRLPHASSYAQTGAGFAEVLGPPLAAPLFVAVGAQLALGLNAASFLVSLLAIRAVRVPRPAAPAPAVAPRTSGSFREDFRAGLEFVRRSRAVVLVLMGAMAVMLAAGAMNALDVYFVQENLRADIMWFGLLGAAYGIGLIAGSASAGVLVARFGGTTVFRFGVPAFGLLCVGYSRATDLGVAVGLNVCFGVVLGLVNTAAFTVLLAAVPRSYLGRTMSVFNPVNQVASISAVGLSGLLAGTVLSGFEADAWGIHFGRIDTVFLVCGLLTTVGGLAVAVLVRTGDG